MSVPIGRSGGTVRGLVPLAAIVVGVSLGMSCGGPAAAPAADPVVETAESLPRESDATASTTDEDGPATDTETIETETIETETIETETTETETAETRTTDAQTTEDPKQTIVEHLEVKVLAVHPHDPTAFTQGLVWDGGLLYESTGLYGKSTLRRVEPTSGMVLDKAFLDPNFFGEGLTMVDGRLVQLTWKAGVAFVYDIASLEVIDEFGYNGEGWGLAFSDDLLVMSDGSSRITTRDPQDFRWLSTLDVLQDGQPVSDINELEFAEGRLYANVWGQDRIVRLDPATGIVDGVIDASGLLSPREQKMVDVLNGIAYDPVSKTFWLTGKFWPKMFQVTFEPVD